MRISNPRSLPQLNLVALNQPYTGNFGGDDMTDKRCHEQAVAMGLPANYRGFVSSKIQTINKDLVPHRFRQSYPITNLRVSQPLSSKISVKQNEVSVNSTRSVSTGGHFVQ